MTSSHKRDNKKFPLGVFDLEAVDMAAEVVSAPQGFGSRRKGEGEQWCSLSSRLTGTGATT